jgi:hypothetical protein
MRIKYLKKPFYHTIIYDFFNKDEIDIIKNEIIELQSVDNQKDEHHKQILENGNIESYLLDVIYNDRRHDSKILNLITKIYNMYWDGKFDLSKNPSLNYIGLSNSDNTVVHAYKNDSSYFEHHDQSVMSFLYPFFDKSFDGGELAFGDYIPKLESNCCLIFPSYEKHKVLPLKTEDTGVVRWSINQRIFIRNG